MAHVPRCFHMHAQGSAKLVCADAFLGRAQQIHGLKPDVQRRVAVLEDGADLDGEGLAAGVALIEADPRRFALELPAVLDNATMWTRASICPNDGLDPLVGGFFVVETWMVGKGVFLRLSLFGGNKKANGVCQVRNNPPKNLKKINKKKKTHRGKEGGGRRGEKKGQPPPPPPPPKPPGGGGAGWEPKNGRGQNETPPLGKRLKPHPGRPGSALRLSKLR